MQLDKAEEEIANGKPPKARVVPLELQRLFTQLQLLDQVRPLLKDEREPAPSTDGFQPQKAVTTEHLTSRGFAWKSDDGQVQHDVQVCANFPCSFGPSLISSGDIGAQPEALRCNREVLAEEAERRHYPSTVQGD